MRMKKLFFTLFLLAFVVQNVSAWGWAVRDAARQNSENPSYFLGDQISFAWDLNADGWGATFKKAGIGTTSSTAGMNWQNIIWVDDAGDGFGGNEGVSSSVFTVTAISTWYYSLWLGWGTSVGDNGHWYNGNIIWNDGSGAFMSSSFTVNALNNPSASTPFSVTNSSVTLAWSKDAQNHNVMIVRKKTTESWTEPTQGTAYAVNATIGDGVVVYNSNGTGYENSGLTSSTGYDYKFYSENNSYYSAGVVASATTETASTDYFRSYASGNWSDASKWESSNNDISWVGSTLAPNSSANTTLIQGGHTISVNNTETVNALTINSTGVLNINAGNSLTISGTLTNNATEGIVLLSPNGSGAPGSLITNGTVTGTGSLKAERYISAYTTSANGWHLISSPVNTPNIASNTTLAPGTNDDFFAWSENTYMWINYKPGNVFTTMANGTGYLVSYIAGNIKTITGTPNNVAVTFNDLVITPDKGKGWHLVGNPFTSAIKWNPTVNNSYALLNIGGVAKTMLSTDGSYDDINPDGIIPAMQGFFVQAVDATNAITIPLNARTHNNSATWNKSTENSSIILAANDLDSQLVQKSWVRFNDQATEGYDYQYDSRFMPLYAPQFYSVAGSEMLSTNCLPSLPAESMIPFGFVKNDASNFSIELKESMEGYEVLLKDVKTNTDQNLTKNPVYTFTSEAADDANRFLLHFLSTVGTTELSSTSAFSIYSNAGNIYVNGATGKADVYVRNMIGQTMIQRSVNGDALKVISAENLTAGVYIVSVVNSTQTLSTKVVIK